MILLRSSFPPYGRTDGRVPFYQGCRGYGDSHEYGYGDSMEILE